MRKSKYEIDMCNGPLFTKIVRFSIPLMLSGILQLLFNAADVIVVGRFAGRTALAAVGSTGALVHLIVSIFMGLSVGVSVATAQYYGAGDKEKVGRVVHTAIATSIIGGVFVSLAGILMAEKLLIIMDTPGDVLGQATLYICIYFIGMPATMIFNYGSAVLGAMGDTQRPLIFLTISGILNVALNLLFVIAFGMGVAGVAIATVIAQALSAVLVVMCLLKLNEPYRLKIKDIRIHKEQLLIITKIGLPAGIQGSLFSISNVLIQSSVNSFGSVAMAGNSAAANLEGFISVAMNSIYQSALTFTGQNAGAKKYDRIKRVLGICALLATGIGTGLGLLALLFGETLLGIYAPGDKEVIAFGMIRVAIVVCPYFLWGLMQVLVGMLRGMGASLTPMIVSVIGVCGFRIVWIYTIFAWDRKLETLYVSYPVSWVITALFHLIFYFIIIRKLERKNAVAEAGTPNQSISGSVT